MKKSPKKNLKRDLEVRKRLIDIIKDKPGIHFRELKREADIAMGELEYHLDVLEKMEIVSKTKTSHYTRFYPAFELGTAEKRIMGLLRQERLRDILLFLISCENPTHGEIAKEFGLLKSTASFHLDKLRRHGLIEKEKKGRKVHFRVKEPERILRLILLYRRGFGEELVKRVEGLWGEL